LFGRITTRYHPGKTILLLQGGFNGLGNPFGEGMAYFVRRIIYMKHVDSKFEFQVTGFKLQGLANAVVLLKFNSL
jgi:hypothetical protein